MHKTAFFSLFFLAASALAAPPVGWRTDGTGRYPDADPPTEWSATKNVVWKCAMPSWSNSTPVIVGDKIFVCSEPTDLVCVSRADGKILWKQSNASDKGSANTHETNGHSSASPVSDGTVVAAVFNNGMAVCYDLDGKLKWSKFIAKPGHGWGSCSSPLIYQDKVLVHFANMTALDLATGNTVWTAPKTDWHWGTPVITRVGEVDVVVTAAGDIIRLSDGKVLVPKLMGLEYNAPIIQGGVAYFISQQGSKAFTLSPKGEDSVEAKVLWTAKLKQDRYYASPLFNDNLVYGITQGRNLSIVNAADGKLAAEKTLDLGGGCVYPSIALAGKYIFVSIDGGTTLVLEPGPEMKQVAKNSLETFRSSPVFEGKRMYIRGYKNLWCIGQ